MKRDTLDQNENRSKKVIKLSSCFSPSINYFHYYVFLFSPLSLIEDEMLAMQGEKYPNCSL